MLTRGLTNSAALYVGGYRCRRNFSSPAAILLSSAVSTVTQGPIVAIEKKSSRSNGTHQYDAELTIRGQSHVISTQRRSFHHQPQQNPYRNQRGEPDFSQSRHNHNQHYNDEQRHRPHQPPTSAGNYGRPQPQSQAQSRQSEQRPPQNQRLENTQHHHTSSSSGFHQAKQQHPQAPQQQSHASFASRPSSPTNHEFSAHRPPSPQQPQVVHHNLQSHRQNPPLQQQQQQHPQQGYNQVNRDPPALVSSSEDELTESLHQAIADTFSCREGQAADSKGIAGLPLPIVASNIPEDLLEQMDESVKQFLERFPDRYMLRNVGAALFVYSAKVASTDESVHQRRRRLVREQNERKAAALLAERKKRDAIEAAAATAASHKQQQQQQSGGGVNARTSRSSFPPPPPPPQPATGRFQVQGGFSISPPPAPPSGGGGSGAPHGASSLMSSKQSCEVKPTSFMCTEAFLGRVKSLISNTPTAKRRDALFAHREPPQKPLLMSTLNEIRRKLMRIMNGKRILLGLKSLTDVSDDRFASLPVGWSGGNEKQQNTNFSHNLKHSQLFSPLLMDVLCAPLLKANSLVMDNCSADEKICGDVTGPAQSGESSSERQTGGPGNNFGRPIDLPVRNLVAANAVQILVEASFTCRADVEAHLGKEKDKRILSGLGKSSELAPLSPLLHFVAIRRGWREAVSPSSTENRKADAEDFGSGDDDAADDPLLASTLNMLKSLGIEKKEANAEALVEKRKNDKVVKKDRLLDNPNAPELERALRERDETYRSLIGSLASGEWNREKGEAPLGAVANRESLPILMSIISGTRTLYEVLFGAGKISVKFEKKNEPIIGTQQNDYVCDGDDDTCFYAFVDFTTRSPNAEIFESTRRALANILLSDHFTFLANVSPSYRYLVSDAIVDNVEHELAESANSACSDPDASFRSRSTLKTVADHDIFRLARFVTADEARHTPISDIIEKAHIVTACDPLHILLSCPHLFEFAEQPRTIFSERDEKYALSEYDMELTSLFKKSRRFSDQIYAKILGASRDELKENNPHRHVTAYDGAPHSSANTLSHDFDDPYAELGTESNSFQIVGHRVHGGSTSLHSHFMPTTSIRYCEPNFIIPNATAVRFKVHPKYLFKPFCDMPDRVLAEKENEYTQLIRNSPHRSPTKLVFKRYARVIRAVRYRLGRPHETYYDPDVLAYLLYDCLGTEMVRAIRIGNALPVEVRRRTTPYYLPFISAYPHLFRIYEFGTTEPSMVLRADVRGPMLPGETLTAETLMQTIQGYLFKELHPSAKSAASSQNSSESGVGGANCHFNSKIVEERRQSDSSKSKGTDEDNSEDPEMLIKKMRTLTALSCVLPNFVQRKIVEFGYLDLKDYIVTHADRKIGFVYLKRYADNGIDFELLVANAPGTKLYKVTNMPTAAELRSNRQDGGDEEDDDEERIGEY